MAHEKKGHLSLTRRLGEEVLIQTPLGDIELVVSHLTLNNVRLVFKASREIPILRGELVRDTEGAKK